MRTRAKHLNGVDDEILLSIRVISPGQMEAKFALSQFLRNVMLQAEG